MMSLDNYDAENLLSSIGLGETLGKIELLNDTNDLKLLLYSAKRNGCQQQIIEAIEEKIRVIENV